jgi:hypothetical protein
MHLFEQILLQEKKDNIIKKFNISQEEKDLYINFFKTHANLENKVDWNAKQDKVIEQIKSLINSTKKSKNEKRKAYLSGNLEVLWEGYNVEILYSNNRFIFVTPLDHAAAVFMDSYDCYGFGAKWCIGDKNTPAAWNNYVKVLNHLFIMVYDSEAVKKYMLDYDPNNNLYIIWDEQDDRIFETSNPKEIEEKFDSVINIEKAFEKTLQFYKQQRRQNRDPKIKEILGKDPEDIECGELLEKVVTKFLNYIKHKGNTISLRYNNDYTFTLITNEKRLVFAPYQSTLINSYEQDILKGKFGKDIKIIDSNWLSYDYEDLIYLEGEQDIYVKQNLQKLLKKLNNILDDSFPNTIISNIECEEVVFYQAFTQELERFTPNISGNVTFLSCYIMNYQSDFLPENITGNIVFDKCTFDNWNELITYKKLFPNNDFKVINSTLPKDIEYLLTDEKDFNEVTSPVHL